MAAAALQPGATLNFGGASATISTDPATAPTKDMGSVIFIRASARWSLRPPALVSHIVVSFKPGIDRRGLASRSSAVPPSATTRCQGPTTRATVSTVPNAHYWSDTVRDLSYGSRSQALA